MVRYDVLIPAYNAEKTISQLITRLRDLTDPPTNIIVVDDGSQDRTVQICEKHSVRVIQNLKNCGKGSVLKLGFKAFLNDSPSEYLLCLDADLQHPVSSVPDFLNTAEDRLSKFVLGMRINRLKVMPGHRILSNLLSSYIISRLTGQDIKDSQCGFRLIHKDVLKKIHLSENGYQLESEMLLKSAREGFFIDCVAIPTVYGGEKSYIRNMSDTFRFTRLIFREIKGRMRWSSRNK